MKSALRNFGLSAFAALAFASAASALPILTINDPGIVGTVEFGIPADPADRVVYVNTLLGMGAGETKTEGGQTYQTSSTDFNGTVSLLGSLTLTGLGSGATEAQRTIPAGYNFVLVKYDGPNAGSVVWALGGAALIVPTYPDTIWGSGDNQYAISGFTAFGGGSGVPGVPDGGSTVTLLGGALMILAGVARRGGSLAVI